MKILNSIVLLIIALFFATIHADNLCEKKITKIIVHDAEYTYDYTLNYDSQNRITTVIPDHSEAFGITNLEYDTNTLRISKGSLYVSCSLNEQGYIKVA